MFAVDSYRMEEGVNVSIESLEGVACTATKNRKEIIVNEYIMHSRKNKERKGRNEVD